MQCVILAAGEGMRMRPLTNDTPKPMLKVAGKPLLEHILNALPERIDEVVLVTGYLGHQIQSHFGDDFYGRKITYLTQEKKLGTYHALELCREHLDESKPFLLLYADDLHGKEGLEHLVSVGKPCLQVAFAEHPERYGVVEIHADSSIRGIEEKPELPRTNLVSAGAKVLTPEIFSYPARQHSNGEFYLTDSLDQMIAAGHQIHTVPASFWLPIGYPEDIIKAEAILAKI